MPDVIVENIKTGKRKQVTLVMARALDTKYRIVPEAKTINPDANFKPPVEKITTLERLRTEYFELFGQQPHHRLGEAKLKALIDDAKK